MSISLMTHTAAAGPNAFCPLLIALYGLIWQHLKSYIFDKNNTLKKRKNRGENRLFYLFFILTGIPEKPGKSQKIPGN